MSSRRSLSVVGLVALTTLLLASCGSSSKTAKAAGPSTTVGSTTTAPANSGIATATDAKLGSVLTDAAGRTLYRFTKETNGSIACTGTCAATWPPFVAPSSGLPSDGPGGGKVATVARPDGVMQVTFNGAALYYYGGDTKAGDTNGQGIGGVWFVVAPAAAAPQTATTGSPAAGATATTARPTATTAKPATNATTAPTSPPATSPPATSPPTTMHTPTTSCAYPPCY
jgi:predicted lipoprotein with Yx(FWY)xxD motif